MSTVPIADPVALCDRLKSRNKDAFKELYNKYASTLYSIICKMVQQPHVGEELLQDVFVKAWKNVDKYDAGKGSLFTWLLQITRNTCIDYMRTIQYRLRFQHDGDGREEVISANDLYYRIEKTELRKLAAQLEFKYRQVIDLVYFWGYSQEEVSRLLHIPLGTVKTRSRTGLQQLRNLCFENDILQETSTK